MGERTILITGCSSGIGWAAAQTMAQRGWRVFATARADDDLDSLDRQGITAFRLDYRDTTTIAATVDAVFEATGGRLDALFNNGAFAIPGAIEDLPTEALRDLFEANFIGWHDLTRRVIPAMRRQGFGRIVQCSSVLGYMYLKYRGAYTASKHALNGYSETLRLELAGSGIEVSIIEPGPIRTRFEANAIAQFGKWIAPEGSPHEALYRRRLQQMETRGGGSAAAAFRLEPDAVVSKLVHAVESPYPRPHYFVTTPAYLLDGMRRVLPVSLMSRAMRRISDSETRD